MFYIHYKKIIRTSLTTLMLALACTISAQEVPLPELSPLAVQSLAEPSSLSLSPLSSVSLLSVQSTATTAARVGYLIFGPYSIPPQQTCKPNGFKGVLLLHDSQRGAGIIPAGVNTAQNQYRWIWNDEPWLSTDDGWVISAGYSGMSTKFGFGLQRAQFPVHNELFFTRVAVNTWVYGGYSSAVYGRSRTTISNDFALIGFNELWSTGTWAGFNKWAESSGKNVNKVQTFYNSLARYEQSLLDQTYSLQHAWINQLDDGRPGIAAFAFYKSWGKALAANYALYRVRIILNALKANP